MEEYDLSLYKYLKKHLNICYLTGSRDETNIRCPFCGDSVKSNLSAHLYINNLPPYKYFCQRCETSGIFDGNLLNMLNLYDPEVADTLNKNKANYIKRLGRKYGNNFLDKFNRELDVLPNDFGKFENSKLIYIENRLGISIDDEEIVKRYKIITNLEDFFDKNDFKLNRYWEENIEKLNKNYVAFLLNDNNQICFRALNKRAEHRYINKKIYHDLPTASRKFYSIRNDINMASPIYNVYLSEGIFDILGVYNHVQNCRMNENDIFISCNGKSYSFVLKYLKSIGILNTDIFIYSDKDVSIEKMRSFLSRDMLVKFNGAKVFYNKLGKDCGVKKNEIELTEGVSI